MNDTARRALVRAAQKVGGMQILAGQLGMTHGALRVYLNGTEPIPDALFLRIVDVLLAPAEHPEVAQPARPAAES